MPRPLALALLLVAAGCGRLRPSTGGGHAWFRAPRPYNAADVRVPAGYRVELVAAELTFPTGVAFDETGAVYVVEAGYSVGEAWATPRLLKLDGPRWSVVATGSRDGPWNGVAYSSGAFYISEGGALEGGGIIRVSRNGGVTRLVEGLPSLGDFHVTGPVAGPDGMIYFGQGAATNSGVVGDDNDAAGWRGRFPGFHDVPCRDIVAAGREFGTVGSTRTGAFSSYAIAPPAGTAIYGALRCNGAIYRLRPDRGDFELVAWGLRHPFGLAFGPSGGLLAVDQGFDERGSRPVNDAPDVLWAIEAGRWYGWPDFSAGKRLSKPVFDRWPAAPPAPAAVFTPHGEASGLDVVRRGGFDAPGTIFVAQFGDLAPMTGKRLRPVGFKLLRVDPKTRAVTDFAFNRGRRAGPASKLGSGGLERPIAARFDPSGEALYVVDFGVVTTSAAGPAPNKGTGCLWRITRAGGPQGPVSGGPPGPYTGR